MKIKMDRNELLKLVSGTQNIVEKKNSMPILVNLLLEAKNSKLQVFATDIEVSLTSEMPAEISEEGRAVINAKNFIDLIRELPEGQVTLERKPNNWVTLSQASAVYNIVGVNPDEYPVFPTFQTKDFLEIESKTLRDMIEKTIYSVSNDETRYHLNGVYFEKYKEESNPDFAYRMVATDGHRLSLIDRKISKNSEGSQGFNEKSGVIIPRKGLNEIRKLLDSNEEMLEMAIEGSQLIVRSGQTLLLIRLIEGKYPNYKQLIPQNLSQHLLINRDALLSSLKRVSLLSNAKSRGVTFSLSKDKMEITSNNPELGDAREEIEIDYKGNEFKIGFNAKYILDVLSTIDEENIQMELNDHHSAGLVRPHSDRDYTCVVMPMRI